MRKKAPLCLILLAHLVAPVRSQIIFSNGAVIQINTGAIVTSHGGVTLSNATSFTNNGTLTITKNSTLPLPGTFTITTGTTASGNGLYEVEQDWINNATFNAGASTVALNGNTQQFITSTNGTVTTFNNLQLTGTGVGNNRKKTLQLVNANTGAFGTLSLNDRELETQTNSFFVLNPSPASVTNNTTPGSEGFVSSASPGVLSRVTNSTSAYVFPTGSSLGTLRYRPVEVIPVAAAAAAYTVRLNNHDPNTDGFLRTTNDGVMCDLNALYYHSILRTSGAVASDIRMFYIGASDGNWSGMAHWRTTNVQWNDMSTMTLGASGVFSTVTRSAWNFTNPGDPYVLTNPRPATPVINCPLVCENSVGNTFTLTGTGTNFQWTFPAGALLTSGQGTSTASASWTTGGGYVYVYAVGSGGCNSLPDSCLTIADPAPVAAFSTTPNGDFGDTYTFTDQSTGAASWLWNFGDGNSSGSQHPIYQYNGAGMYQVILTATNAAGCSDTASYWVNPGEGIVIPNVFSPNGDGSNDGYYIKSSGLSDYALQIFNRWGQLMFESTDIQQPWDGNGPNGQPCPDGTYFFILKATSTTKDHSTNGTITLFRTKK